MIHLATSRLVVRPFAETDIDAVVRIQDDCFGRSPREARRAWLEWTVRNYAALASLHQPPYGDYAVALRDGDEKGGAVIGAVGLVPSFGPFGKLPGFRAGAAARSDELFTPELGLFWAIESPHRGRGYASEAAAVLVHFAFESMRALRVVATTEHDNAASIAVMRKLGMRIERNPDATPPWFQTVGILENPSAPVVDMNNATVSP